VDQAVITILSELVANDAPRIYTVGLNGLDDPDYWSVGGLSGMELDESLREAQRTGLLDASRQTYDGSMVTWSNPRLTLQGLIALGEWPRPGGEYLPGPWDDRYWGRVARPLLERLKHDRPHHGFMQGPDGGWADDEWREWVALHRLIEAGLVDGEGGSSGVSEVRVTVSGMQALEPPVADPLVEAEIALRQGNKETATIAAVERALADRMKALVPVGGTGDADTVKGLSNLNNMLGKAGVYDEATRTQIDAWLKLRNDVAHGRADAVSEARIALLIKGVRVFLAEHPA
jgi:hypothetical protein